MEQRDLERLAVLENQTGNIEKLVIRLDTKLDTYVSNHVTKVEMADALRYRDNEIKELKDDRIWLRRQVIGSIITGAISLICAVVLGLLALGGK